MNNDKMKVNKNNKTKEKQKCCMKIIYKICVISIKDCCTFQKILSSVTAFL